MPFVSVHLYYMQRRLLYIVNPISGTKGKTSLKDLIQQQTKAAGLAFNIVNSVRDGDYRFLLPFIEEKNITDIIIAGGDGTVNGVIGSLRHANVSFGILPCGSGNGLAFAAGIPKSMEQALQIIFNGTATDTDAFRVNGQFACMLAGLGFDAQVAYDFAQYHRRGKGAYINRIIRQLFKAPLYSFAIATGGQTMEVEAYLMSIANSNQFGNQFTIAPQASLTDGWLDVVIVAGKTKAEFLWHALRQVSGLQKVQEIDMLRPDAGLFYFQAKEVAITNTQKAPLHIDGDPAEAATIIDIQIAEKAFRLIYP